MIRVMFQREAAGVPPGVHLLSDHAFHLVVDQSHIVIDLSLKTHSYDQSAPLTFKHKY